MPEIPDVGELMIPSFVMSKKFDPSGWYATNVLTLLFINIQGGWERSLTELEFVGALNIGCCIKI